MLADAPLWLQDWARNRHVESASTNDRRVALGEPPAYLRAEGSQRNPDITARLEQALRPPWNAHEEAQLRSALAYISAVQRDDWLRVGMGIHEAGWGARGFEIWSEWSRSAPEQYNDADQARTWESFDRPSHKRPVTLATVFHMARARGWTGASLEPTGGQISSSSTESQPQIILPVAGPSALRWHGEEDLNIKRGWLAKQILPETGAGLISGQWGTAKTFVAIDLGTAVMLGTSFAGRPIKRKGGVLFVAAEGASEIPIRLSGVIDAKAPDHQGKLPFAWVESCPTLTDNDAIAALESIAKQAAVRMKDDFGVDLVLIIIDTMSAAAGFTDENSSAEGQKAMNALNELSRRTRALVLACDHFGKMADTGTRGTSAKEASADVVIACLGDKSLSGDLSNSRIAIRKLRGGATGAQTAFKLRKVDMGVDEDHEPVTTCVIDWSPVSVAPPPETDKGKSWPKSATLFRMCLVTVLATYGREQRPFPDAPAVRAVELERVREEFNKRYPLDDDERKKQMNKRRQLFRRSRTEAESRKLVEGREIDGTFMIWMNNPEDGASRTGVTLTRGKRHSSVTT